MLTSINITTSQHRKGNSKIWHVPIIMNYSSLKYTDDTKTYVCTIIPSIYMSHHIPAAFVELILKASSFHLQKMFYNMVVINILHRLQLVETDMRLD